MHVDKIDGSMLDKPCTAPFPCVPDPSRTRRNLRRGAHDQANNARLQPSTRTSPSGKFRRRVTATTTAARLTRAPGNLRRSSSSSGSSGDNVDPPSRGGSKRPSGRESCPACCCTSVPRPGTSRIYSAVETSCFGTSLGCSGRGIWPRLAW